MKQRRKKRGSDSESSSCTVTLDKRTRTIRLIGDICLEMYQKFTDAVAPLTYSTGAIEVYINSTGGDVSQAFAIYDEIRQLKKNHVTTVAIGECYSGAAIILQAGDRRKATENADIMVHKGSYGLPDEFADENYAAVDHYKKMDKKHRDVFAEAKVGKLGVAKYFTAAEALKANLIDEVLEC